ncbi:MAG TPA: AmmeMemoRadiSam system radical SAM enzyme [Candidatus Avalokitesvara rifleensis]|uniref:AmmeMemoRadiSam system radical SAM enzyme n=1 Tax=Candidatus Avalokitesvara rifleensis TaxID=3367620 RepID=UPI0027126EF2|nr:AmmeMemoRadiSam system radical SAM enzyme [Candidatus Brocadiales bacterium]
MFKHEALFYKPTGEDGRVQCFLCPHRCIIAPGRLGFCGARQNIDGKLYSLIYGRVSSVCADPIEKKPLYHFYPGSVAYSIGSLGCNMRCGDCQNWQIAHAKADKTIERTGALSPEQLVANAKKSGSQGIAWTYNEPTIWMEYAIDGAKLAKAGGLYTVFVTNGYVEAEALDAIGPYLDAFRVDFKGRLEGSRFYKEVAKIKDPRPVLEATKRAKNKWNMHVEVITNVVPGYNDSPDELKDIAKTIKENLGDETPWHVTRFHPYLELSHVPSTPVEKLEEAWDIGRNIGLKYVYVGNVPDHPGENTYCGKCAELLIERLGYYVNIVGLEDGKCRFCGHTIPIVGSI